ncbi:MAG: hypothetical protein JRG76_13940 [Deltaproteobacteria bacterium]|nr:hypothetical protein [Deltaproteobacteria bacterium]
MSRQFGIPALLISLAMMATVAAAQGDREGQGLTREQMWPAPTAEDWKKPCLITWQRTWEDAVAVSRETGKPILVCINMDGEIASEHYAGVRYRQPEVTALYEPYVTVIASVYRHNPRDHDDSGRRIPCPRFGGVTCAEHIWIEPIIYEKFCDGQRVAPRHITVDLSGKEVSDVFYTDDTASVFDSVREGRAKLPPSKPPIVRSDRPILERVASRHVADRGAVENAYRRGDPELRRSLLEATLKHNDTAAQIDLLRLAIFGLDADLSRAARRTLAEVKTADAAELVSDALQVPMDAAERDALIAALKRLGDGSVRAQWLAGVHQGLAGDSSMVDLKAWSGPRPVGTPPAAVYGGGGRLSHVEKQARAAYERPKDPTPRIEYAEASLALALAAPRTYALNPRIGRRVASYLFKDARRASREAEALGAKGWRLNAVLALAAYYEGDREEGYKAAAEAMKDLPAGDRGWASMAVVTVFAESRWKAIRAAVKEQKDWPVEWLSDLHSAYTLLLRHPLGTDGQVLWHYELLDWLGARYRANRTLWEGLARFPDSSRLHERLRDRLLKWRGPDGLEAAYRKMLADRSDPARLAPFAAVASIAAADHHRRTRAYEKALAAYARAIEHYESAIQADADNRASADPAIAIALAARARVAYELGDDARAVTEILASFARHPDSAGTRDGVGIKAGETAQMLLVRLREKKKDDLASRLETALSGIDPELLRPDEE